MEALEWISLLSLGVMIIGIICFFLLLIIPAPYGRYHDSKIFSVFGNIPGRVGWVLMESPNLIIPGAIAISVFPSFLFTVVNHFLLMLYILHYINRALIYPFLQSNKPHNAISLACALIFCSINGYIQGYSLLVVYEYSTSWLLQPNLIAGVMLWAAGFYINLYSDHILRNLRKPGETGYKIPTGFLYEYVSCANYLGEIIEWGGYALACWNIAALSFLMFTACNLIPRSMQHHKYYKEKFEDYPASRKAIIPFLL